MHHGRDAMVRQRGAHLGGVADVALDQRDLAGVGRGQLLDGLAMALREVVVDDRLVAGAQQRLRREAADVAGAAGDENAAHVTCRSRSR